MGRCRDPIQFNQLGQAWWHIHIQSSSVESGITGRVNVYGIKGNVARIKVNGRTKKKESGRKGKYKAAEGPR